MSSDRRENSHYVTMRIGPTPRHTGQVPRRDCSWIRMGRVLVKCNRTMETIRALGKRSCNEQHLFVTSVRSIKIYLWVLSSPTCMSTSMIPRLTDKREICASSYIKNHHACKHIFRSINKMNICTICSPHILDDCCCTYNEMMALMMMIHSLLESGINSIGTVVLVKVKRRFEISVCGSIWRFVRHVSLESISERGRGRNEIVDKRFKFIIPAQKKKKPIHHTTSWLHSMFVRIGWKK